MPSHRKLAKKNKMPRNPNRNVVVNWRSPSTMQRVQVTYAQAATLKHVDGRQLVRAVAEQEEKEMSELKIFYDDAAEPLNGDNKTTIKISIVDAMLNDKDTDVWIELSVYAVAPEAKKDKKKKKKKKKDSSSSDGKQHSPATKRI